MIEASDIVVRAGPAVLLDRVSFEARSGRVTAVLGPNGAGKSTLLKVLAGSLAPAAGSVSLGGRPLSQWTRRETAKRRAILSQRTDLTFPFSVIDVVLLGRSPYAGETGRGVDTEIAFRCMEMAGVPHLAARTYTTLSGGEQQRVQLARVLAQLHRPDGVGEAALLLDEPTSSLDIAHQHGMLSLARSLAGEGLTVVAVLHDLNLAAMFADEVYLMKSARVAAFGPPQEAIAPETVEDVFGVRVRIVPHPDRPGGYVLPIH